MIGLLNRTDKSSITMIPVTPPAPPEAKLTRSFTVSAGTRRRPETRSKGELEMLPVQPGLWPSARLVGALKSVFARVKPIESMNAKLKRILPFVVL
jgi:hypothetical protein